MTKIMDGKSFAVSIALLAAAGTSAPARATPEQVQALRSCITLSTSGKDRIAAVRWIFAALGSAPQLHDIANIDPQKKKEADQQMAALFTRLMTVDCLKEAKPMFQHPAGGEMREAGGELGRIAVQELFGDGKADAAVGDFTSYLHEEDFAVLTK